MHRRSLGGEHDVVVRELRPVEADVVGHGAVDELRRLRHVRHALLPVVPADGARIDAVDQQRARPGLAQPQEELHERRLARA